MSKCSEETAEGEVKGELAPLQKRGRQGTLSSLPVHLISVVGHGIISITEQSFHSNDYETSSSAENKIVVTKTMGLSDLDLVC